MSNVSSIRHAAAECRKVLENSLSLPPLMEEEWAENRLADFNLWAAGIGVFANEGVSLDDRLAQEHDTKSVFVNLLRTLKKLVEGCQTKAEDVASRSAQVTTRQSIRSGSVLDEISPQGQYQSPCVAQDNRAVNTVEARQAALREKMDNVQTVMKHIVRLTISVRRSGAYSRLQKADGKYDPRSHQDLQDHLWFLLTLHPPERLQGPLTAIQWRLIMANLRRRNRFMYAQRHAQKLAEPKCGTKLDELPRTAVQSLPWRSILNRLRTPIRWRWPETLPVPSYQHIIQSAKTSKQVGNLSETAATTFQGPLSSPPPISSRPTASNTPSLTCAQVNYPPAPVPKDGQDYIECICCFQVLGPEFSRKAKWKKHLAEDILPYTCILDECPRPLDLYMSRSAWIEHMKSSHQGFDCWICPICPAQARFLRETEFDLHLQESHLDSIPRDKIPALVLSGHRSVPVEVACCPLCPQAHSQEGAEATVLLDHIAEHVHEFSLRSLPWPSGDKSDSDKVAEGTSAQGNDSVVVDNSDLKEATKDTDSEQNDDPAVEDYESNKATEGAYSQENDYPRVDDPETRLNEAQAQMERADLLLAREALPIVSEIATELAAEIQSYLLGAFGARLACFAAELPYSTRGLKDERRLNKALCEVLEEVEKACTWPKWKGTPDFFTLRALTESGKEKRNIFS